MASVVFSVKRYVEKQHNIKIVVEYSDWQDKLTLALRGYIMQMRANEESIKDCKAFFYSILRNLFTDYADWNASLSHFQLVL